MLASRDSGDAARASGRGLELELACPHDILEDDDESGVGARREGVGRQGVGGEADYASRSGGRGRGLGATAVGGRGAPESRREGEAWCGGGAKSGGVGGAGAVAAT